MDKWWGNVRIGGWFVAVAGLVQVGFGLVLVGDPAGHRPGSFLFRIGLVPFALVGLFTLYGVVTVRQSGLAGGWLGLAGALIAGLGRLAHAVGEVLLRVQPPVGEKLLMGADPVSGIGLVLLGVAILLTKAWRGVGRFAMLATGLFVFVVLVPSFAVSHGPNFLAVAAWGVLWTWLGLAMTIAAPLTRAKRLVAEPSADSGANGSPIPDELDQSFRGVGSPR